ncbi:hypothetical protein DXC40_04070 [Anaerotruncus colihominis]|uniref:Uncharacterized protein n=1 Tax=Anaerotruncus colihominis TaxID=169435 RepID=A0A3E3IT38_9FIRM|nr:hypothetical protein DXC40_04070 [Anaerotruncus colihominis]
MLLSKNGGFNRYSVISCQIFSKNLVNYIDLSLDCDIIKIRKKSEPVFTAEGCWTEAAFCMRSRQIFAGRLSFGKNNQKLYQSGKKARRDGVWRL